MRLRYSPTSPYVRKVSAVAIETGLAASIERIATNPWDPATDLGAHNPLGKVPALLLDDGQVLFDSPVICEYLDSLHEGARMFPPPGAARWQALRWQALGDGILDAAVLVFIENGRRPPEYRWGAWVDGQMQKITRALDALGAEVAALGGPPGIGQITLACALGYLDFRIAEFPWREGRGALADWYGAICERQSLAETVPRDPV